MKNLFVIFLLLLVSFGTYAQPGGEGRGERMRARFENQTPEERAQQQTNKMHELVTLSDEQKGKVNEINLKFEKLAQEQFEANKDGGDPYVFMESMRDIRRQRNEALKTVLTEAQLQTLRENDPRRNRQEPRQGKGKKKKPKGNQ